MSKIMVVDDEMQVRHLTCTILKREGYEVLEAENGREALSMIKRYPPDLILLDIMMPEQNGYEVLDLLKLDENSRHIPVVIVSATTALNSIVRCIERGADDYLVKPFEWKMLLARISACLDRKHLLDEERRLHGALADSYTAMEDIHTRLNGMLDQIQAARALAEASVLDRDALKAMHQEVYDTGRTLSGLLSGLLDKSK